MAIIELDR